MGGPFLFYAWVAVCQSRVADIGSDGVKGEVLRVWKIKVEPVTRVRLNIDFGDACLGRMRFAVVCTGFARFNCGRIDMSARRPIGEGRPRGSGEFVLPSFLKTSLGTTDSTVTPWSVTTTRRVSATSSPTTTWANAPKVISTLNWRPSRKRGIQSEGSFQLGTRRLPSPFVDPAHKFDHELRREQRCRLA